MLAFIIALRSPKTSNSWSRVCKIFERTLKSTCNQTAPSFRVVVVCHEKPEVYFNHPAIDFVVVDFPIPTWTNSQDFSSRENDKARKLWAGLNHLKSSPPDYVMYLDADDLVSKDLAAFCQQFPSQNGWFMDSGYEYSEGSHSVYQIKTGFYNKCGSTSIIRYDLSFKLRDLPYEKVSMDRLVYHPLLPRTMSEDMKAPLTALPFIGTVYVVDSGENNLHDKKQLLKSFQGSWKKTSAFYLRRMVKKLLSHRLTDEMRDRFSIYDLEI